MIYGGTQSLPANTKRQDIPCNLAIVSTQDQDCEYAMVFFQKKNKKIEIVVPIIAELQVWWTDSISFEIFWDPLAYDKQDHK